MEARSDFEQAADPPVQLDPTRRGSGDAGEELEQCRLARAVSTDDPDGFALHDLEVDGVECIEQLDLVATERLLRELHESFACAARRAAVADAIRLGDIGC